MRKTIFITGVSSGIGWATAKYFTNKGWFVVGVDIKSAPTFLENMIFFGLDVSKEGKIRSLVDKLYEKRVKIDILFNCAGILKMGKFVDVGIEDHLLTIAVNFQAIVSLIYHLRRFVNRGGVIINMSSLSAIYGVPELSSYSATKSAIKSLTESLNVEFSDYGISVCDIISGYIKTPMITEASYKAKSVKRIGFDAEVEDIAKIVFKIYFSRRRVHYVVGKKTKFLYFSSAVMPFLKKHVVKILSA